MFSDLKIIDISSVLAGPSVGTFFAELGTQVIKIEHPTHPDVTRTWKLSTESIEDQNGAYFSSVNYKKKYLQLDLKLEKDYLKFMELIATADILLSNFKKGDAEKLKITDEILRATNKRLIHGKITGFGNESDRVAYDLILQAETGFMSMNGTPESGPVKIPVALIDVLAAHHLKEALLIALLDRTHSELGKTVSVSLYDAAVCSLANQASNYLMQGAVAQRIGSLHPNIAPYGELFETKDKALITFAIGSNTHFEKLCHLIDLENLPVHPDFATNQNRIKNRIALQELIQEKVKEFDSKELIHDLTINFVPAGKITQIDEVFENKAAHDLIRTELIDGKETKRVTSIAFKWE